MQKEPCKRDYILCACNKDVRLSYEVATVSSIDKIIILFGRILSLLWGSFAKETYNLIDPTKQNHRIHVCMSTVQFCYISVWIDYNFTTSLALLCVCLILSPSVSPIFLINFQKLYVLAPNRSLSLSLSLSYLSLSLSLSLSLLSLSLIRSPFLLPSLSFARALSLSLSLSPLSRALSLARALSLTRTHTHTHTKQVSTGYQQPS